MFKRVIVAAAVLTSCPALVFSQDISFLFGGSLPEAGGGPATNSLLLGDSVSSGSVNIYSRAGLRFHAADLNFFSSDIGVARITGGEAFNPGLGSFGAFRWDGAELTTDTNASSGNFFAVSASGNGIGNPVFFPILPPFGDPLFDSTVGPNGSFLLARVDYDIVGTGTAEFSVELGTQGILELPDIVLNPSFGSATLNVTGIPEPASATVLMMGFVAAVARRKRV